MMSLNNFKKIVHSLYLDKLYESMKECWQDERGGFLIPMSAKLVDSEYEKYRHLAINWSIASITKEDLPKEFSVQAVKTIDMFRRKTIDLDYECMILFDYITGNIISCNFSDESEDDKVESVVFPDVLKGMNIASIHNHPNKYFSPPSGKNFQMLGFEFEEFELIISQNELWILKSENLIFNEGDIQEIREKANEYFNICYENINQDFQKGYLIIDNVNRCYGDRLLNYLNRKFENIILVRRYLDE